jgi:gliding motility-associated-like protein
MKKWLPKFYLISFVFFNLVTIYSCPSAAQYILNGSATQNSCNCYTLTPALFTQAGSVWNSNKINLNNPFDYWFNVYLGCQDANGADGIVFILQPLSTSIGGTGEGMGFSGIFPSIGITLDTWQNSNLNDPAYDHISIQANGNPAHGSDLAGPVQASASSDNIEDCQWHILRISWDPATQWLRAYFDGVLRVEVQINLVATIFNNDPNVYWGFTAATGGANNLQQFCTALNPGIITIPNNAVCFGTPITFADSSVSFAPIQSWYWNFGDGTTSTLQNPPPHQYAAPGVYEVKLVITGLDGCISDTLRKNITVGTKPVASFEVFDTCAGNAPRVNDLSTNAVGTISQWTWLVDDVVVSASQQPVLSNLSAGTHSLKLVVKTNIGCESDTAVGTFVIRPAPVIDMIAPDGCLDETIQFAAVQLDNATSIVQWAWDFGNGNTSVLPNPSQSFSIPGWAFIRLTALASNGCYSATQLDTVSIEYLYAYAMNDTLVIPNSLINLNATYGGNFNGPRSITWWPATGLDNPNTLYPKATITDDITYTITITSNAGCTASDSVQIKVFKGSAVYVPTGFTPNGDGRNDLLRALYIGIKKVYYFRVYNRWGQLVFSTTNLTAGWDGTINGVKQQTGTYVWMLKAEDLAGKVYEMKGTSTLIR